MRPFSGMLVLAWLLAAAPGGAAALEKHSGVVTGVEGTQITIDEMGPWLGPETKPMRRAFQLTSATRVERVERTAKGSEGWSWSYVSRPQEPSDLRPGDYVTVTVDPEERRNAAIEVEALQPGPNALN
jgi:hypothetical protein